MINSISQLYIYQPMKMNPNSVYELNTAKVYILFK